MIFKKSFVKCFFIITKQYILIFNRWPLYVCLERSLIIQTAQSPTEFQNGYSVNGQRANAK